MMFIYVGVCMYIYVVGFMRVTYCFGCSGWLGVWVVGVCHSIHTFDYRRNVHSYIGCGWRITTVVNLKAIRGRPFRMIALFATTMV